jgi:hypothetical protein
MSLRDVMRDSAALYLRPGEPVQAVIGAQTGRRQRYDRHRVTRGRDNA